MTMEIAGFLRPISQPELEKVYYVDSSLVGALLRWLNSVVPGYFNYHAVPGNMRRLNVFRQRVTRLWRRTLLRLLVDNDATRSHYNLLENTSDGRKLIYFVNLQTTTAEPIFEKDLQRWLCDNKLLRGRRGERSKVAVRVDFYLRTKFQRAGLATYILPREEQAFRKWGAREIQTMAMDSGRWVWMRARFGYGVDDFQLRSLQERYKEWQRERGATSIALITDLASLPQDFLQNVSSLTLFKSLQ